MTEIKVMLKPLILGMLIILVALTGCGKKIPNRQHFNAQPRTAPVTNTGQAKRGVSFSEDEIEIFKRIAALDNPQDPDAGPPFIYSSKYCLTPDGGKTMLFDKDEISDYPNDYQVVYYPAYHTVLFSWDGGQADRGCCTYVVMDRLVMKTIIAGGLSIWYEKVYQNGVPIYYKVEKTDLPSTGAEPKIKQTDLIGKWKLNPDITLNFKANGNFEGDINLLKRSWSFNPYNQEIYINMNPPAVRILKIITLTKKDLKVSEAGKESIYRRVASGTAKN